MKRLVPHFLSYVAICGLAVSYTPANGSPVTEPVPSQTSNSATGIDGVELAYAGQARQGGKSHSSAGNKARSGSSAKKSRAASSSHKAASNRAVKTGKASHVNKGSRNVASNKGANVKHRGANVKNKNVNVNNRNVNVNNRNVNVNVNKRYYGGYYRNGHYNRYYHYYGGRYGYYDGGIFHPLATALAIGAIVAVLPPNCTTMVVNGISYRQCGNYWYQPQYDGPDVTYVVINQPR